MEEKLDEPIPGEYINNENPFVFLENYHQNSIFQPEQKQRLNALMRMQPHRVNFKVPQRQLEKEKDLLVENAIAAQRDVLVARGLKILGVHFHDNAEILFEQHLDIPEILDIALTLKKHKLSMHQKGLRTKVSFALSKKLPESVEHSIYIKGQQLEVDNLRDALVLCKLEELYNKSG
ncbi:hypothetical protein ENBRE01_0461 [Enteropsectra breve]|nr:hypothetical protein ENBRE01_0461 [Enteropsectra breve]